MLEARPSLKAMSHLLMIYTEENRLVHALTMAAKILAFQDARYDTSMVRRHCVQQTQAQGWPWPEG